MAGRQAGRLQAHQAADAIQPVLPFKGAESLTAFFHANHHGNAIVRISRSFYGR